MKCILALGMFAAGVAVAGIFSSCTYAEIIDFIHKDTVDLPKKPSILDKSLDSYRVGNVVFTPRVTHLDNQVSKLDLLVYAETEVKNIAVDSAIIRVGSGETLSSMRSRIDVAMHADSVNTGIFVGGVTLIDQIQDTTLQSASASNTLCLTLFVEVGGTKQQLTYQLTRHSRKYIIQR